jgi:hypothetical protein
MQSGVKRIHEMSQKKLKGMPKGIGRMRSQSETERHMATKGIKPIRIAPSDGLRINPGCPTESLPPVVIWLVAPRAF